MKIISGRTRQEKIAVYMKIVWYVFQQFTLKSFLRIESMQCMLQIRVVCIDMNLKLS